jgi:glyoxylase-like metal-dependent hydrolase (beta-lactamase superfamily II)
MRPRALLPGHGPEVEDPSSLIDAYVLHRTNREKQIVGALRDGLDDVADISGRIYPDIDSALHAAAVDTVLAHLIKLEEDGRAERAGGRWRLTASS